MTSIDLVALWQSYGNILWEPSQHKDTCKGYVAELQEIVIRHRVEQLDNQFLDTVVSELRAKGNRNSTINRKMACLSKLLRKHQRNGGIDRLPDFAKLPEKNGRIRFLSRDEEAFLFACLDAQDPDYGALARFLIATGARIGEALSLTWADCEDGHATFWETKANTPRTVPLTIGAIKVLDGQKGKFHSGPFVMVRYANFRNAWLRAKRQCGLNKDMQVVPHVLRHTCASRLAQNGVDIKRIQEFLGHRTLAMTLRYAHLAPRHLDVCAQALNAFDAKSARVEFASV
jgi:integrase